MDEHFFNCVKLAVLVMGTLILFGCLDWVKNFVKETIAEEQRKEQQAELERQRQYNEWIMEERKNGYYGD